MLLKRSCVVNVLRFVSGGWPRSDRVLFVLMGSNVSVPRENQIKHYILSDLYEQDEIPSRRREPET